MNVEEIPLFPEVPAYDFRVSLDGRDYLLTFDYSGREDRWYVAIATADGTRLAGAQKAVCNVPLFRRKAWDPRMPGGGALMFLTLDTRASNADPGFAELGRRVRLYWVTS